MDLRRPWGAGDLIGGVVGSGGLLGVILGDLQTPLSDLPFPVSRTMVVHQDVSVRGTDGIFCYSWGSSFFLASFAQKHDEELFGVKLFIKS